MRNYILAIVCFSLSASSLLGQGWGWGEPDFIFTAADCVVRHTSYDSFREMLTRLDAQNEFARLCVADGLRPMLAETRRRGAIRGVQAPSEPDLTSVGETAAWLLDHLLEKAGSGKDGSREERLATWKKRAIERHAGSKAKTAELERQFANKIKLGSVGVSDPQAKVLYRLLGEWFPYGKSPEELLRIMNIKPESPGCTMEKTRMVLSGEDEMGGFSCVFTLKDGLIEAVHISGW